MMDLGGATLIRIGELRKITKNEHFSDNFLGVR
jgi:hypothetical protein